MPFNPSFNPFIFNGVQSNIFGNNMFMNNQIPQFDNYHLNGNINFFNPFSNIPNSNLRINNVSPFANNPALFRFSNMFGKN